MARAATTTDSAAIAEPRRRDILTLLAATRASGGRHRRRPGPGPAVGVPKPLRVLLDVGLVDVRRDGRQAFYRTNADGIRPVRAWAASFERYWRHQLGRVKARAERN